MLDCIGYLIWAPFLSCPLLISASWQHLFLHLYGPQSSIWLRPVQLLVLLGFGSASWWHLLWRPPHWPVPRLGLKLFGQFRMLVVNISSSIQFLVWSLLSGPFYIIRSLSRLFIGLVNSIVLNGPISGCVARVLVNCVAQSTLYCIICFALAWVLLPYGPVMVSLHFRFAYACIYWGFLVQIGVF